MNTPQHPAEKRPEVHVVAVGTDGERVRQQLELQSLGANMVLRSFSPRDGLLPNSASEVDVGFPTADLLFVVAGSGKTDIAATRSFFEQIRPSRALKVAIVVDSPPPEPIVLDRIRAPSSLGLSADALLTVPRSDAAQGPTDELATIAVRTVYDAVTTLGLVNINLDDIRSVLSEDRAAAFAISTATGRHRATSAAAAVVDSLALPDLGSHDHAFHRASHFLITIYGGDNMGLLEINDAIATIQDAADVDAEIVFTALIDQSLTNELRVSVLATWDRDRARRPRTSDGHLPTESLNVYFNLSTFTPEEIVSHLTMLSNAYEGLARDRLELVESPPQPPGTRFMASERSDAKAVGE